MSIFNKEIEAETSCRIKSSSFSFSLTLLRYGTSEFVSIFDKFLHCCICEHLSRRMCWRRYEFYYFLLVAFFFQDNFLGKPGGKCIGSGICGNNSFCVDGICRCVEDWKELDGHCLEEGRYEHFMQMSVYRNTNKEDIENGIFSSC